MHSLCSFRSNEVIECTRFRRLPRFHFFDRLRIRQRRYNGIMMDRVPPKPVKDPPNLIRSGSFSLDRLLTHIDPGTAEESEDLVNRIYGQRHIDLSSDRCGKTGR
jgi:hypothetical protein